MPISTPACPLCRKPRHQDYAPFCSKGCRDRDLLSWLGEGYRLPVKAPREAGDDETD